MNKQNISKKEGEKMKEFKCVKCGKSFGEHLLSPDLVTTENGDTDIFGFYNSFSTEHIGCGGKVEYFIDGRMLVR